LVGFSEVGCMITLRQTRGNLGMDENISSYLASVCWSPTIVSFVYRSVHALSKNKLATTQTDELLKEM